MAARGGGGETADTPGRVIPPADMPSAAGEDPHARVWVDRARAWGEAGKTWTLCAILIGAAGVLLLIIGLPDPRLPEVRPGQERVEGTVRARLSRSGSARYRVADPEGRAWDVVAAPGWDAGDPIWIVLDRGRAVSISDRPMPRDLAVAGGAVAVIAVAGFGGIVTAVRLRRRLGAHPYPDG